MVSGTPLKTVAGKHNLFPNDYSVSWLTYLILPCSVCWWEEFCHVVCESQCELRQSYLGHRFWSFPLCSGEEVALETFRSNREPLRSSLKSPDVCLTSIQGPVVSPPVSVQHSRHWPECSCCVLSYGKTGKTCRGKKKEDYLCVKPVIRSLQSGFTSHKMCSVCCSQLLFFFFNHPWLQHKFFWTYTLQATPFPAPNEEIDFTWLICFQQITWASFYMAFHACFCDLILFAIFSLCSVIIVSLSLLLNTLAWIVLKQCRSSSKDINDWLPGNRV